MLIVSKKDDVIRVRFNYFRDYIDRIRLIPGVCFDSASKYWLFHISNFEMFEKIFKGEIMYETPRWEITGEEKPDYKEMYTIKKDIKVPKLKLNPYDYQDFGIKFMVDKLEDTGFIINADDVGLGKTIQTIGTAKYYIDNCSYKRILIVCKKSLKTQWRDEIIKFTNLNDTIPIHITGDTKAKRTKLYKEVEALDSFILITNYHPVLKDTDYLKELKFDMMIVDEVHTIKSRVGLMNKAAGVVASETKKNIFLTGTPIMSKPEDLFGIVKIATKKYFGSWKSFSDNYIVKDYSARYEKTVGFKNIDELRDKVQNILIRRTENEVSIDLPESINKCIKVDLDKTQVEINSAIQIDIDEQRDKSDVIKERLAKKISEEERNKLKDDLEKIEGMAKGLHAALQVVANDPRILKLSKSRMMRDNYGSLIPANYKSSPKFEALIETIDDIVQAGQKVIIFSRFERCCRLIANEIEDKLNIPALLYTGEVSQEERDDNKKKFNDSFEYNVIVLSDAGAEGLNLQSSNHVINVEQPFNQAIKTQRKGRARRAGSKHTTMYEYDFISLNSCDETALSKIKKESQLFNGLVNVDKAQSEALKEAMKG